MASGITMDWGYGAEGSFSFTTEVGGSWFWPEESEIPGLVAENLYSNIWLSLWRAYVHPRRLRGGGNGRLDPEERRDSLENTGIRGRPGVTVTIERRSIELTTRFTVERRAGGAPRA
jgi:hypothetical protein